MLHIFIRSAKKIMFLELESTVHLTGLVYIIIFNSRQIAFVLKEPLNFAEIRYNGIE